jgi:hypothetical protein
MQGASFAPYLIATWHHRTQLTVYLRMLNKPVPSVYGPTSDQTFTGPTPPRQSKQPAGNKRGDVHSQCHPE